MAWGLYTGSTYPNSIGWKLECPNVASDLDLDLACISCRQFNILNCGGVVHLCLMLRNMHDSRVILENFLRMDVNLHA